MSGALQIRPGLEEDVAQPDTFLRQSVVASRSLMIRACAVRAQGDLATDEALSKDFGLAPLDEEALSQMDLGPYLRRDFAQEAANLTELLDKVLAACLPGPPHVQAQLLAEAPVLDVHLPTLGLARAQVPLVRDRTQASESLQRRLFRVLRAYRVFGICLERVWGSDS